MNLYIKRVYFLTSNYKHTYVTSTVKNFLKPIFILKSKYTSKTLLKRISGRNIPNNSSTFIFG